MACLVQTHYAFDDLAEPTRATVAAEGHEVRASARVIVALQAYRAPTMTLTVKLSVTP